MHDLQCDELMCRTSPLHHRDFRSVVAMLHSDVCGAGHACMHALAAGRMCFSDALVHGYHMPCMSTLISRLFCQLRNEFQAMPITPTYSTLCR